MHGIKPYSALQTEEQKAQPQKGPAPSGPVHMAALKGQPGDFEIVVGQGSKNALDTTGRTPLHCAIEGARMNAVRMLITRGPSVTLKDGKGMSPLRLAVEYGLEEAVMLLLEKGVDPNR